MLVQSYNVHFSGGAQGLYHTSPERMSQLCTVISCYYAAWTILTPSSLQPKYSFVFVHICAIIYIYHVERVWLTFSNELQMFTVLFRRLLLVLLVVVRRFEPFRADSGSRNKQSPEE